MIVVFVSLDCVRPDYLTHQFFQELASEGVTFSPCITSASHTSTSHVSMLTGKYPFNHSVSHLVNYNVRGQMIQELLKEQGFTTGALIGGYPLTQGDLSRGFDYFCHEPLVHDISEGRDRYVPINVLVQQVVEWISEQEGKDLFIFIHSFDAHLTLRSEFAGGETPEKDETGRYKEIERHLGRRERRYQEVIDFIGSQLALLNELADIDLLALTADHGEKMQGEHNYPWVANRKGEIVASHFHEVELYEPQIIVPLMFKGRGLTQANHLSMVRTIDIAPTILDYLEVPVPEGTDGVSLLPMLQGREGTAIESAYSETYFAQFRQNNRHVMEMSSKYKFGWVNLDCLVSLRTPHWKLICTADNKLEPYQLFNVAEYPQEGQNLLAKEKTVAEKLFGQLTKMLAEDQQYREGESTVADADIVARLKGLGYL